MLKTHMHPVSSPLFLCDTYADERFRGCTTAVCLVPTSVYCMDWCSVSSLEASFGRGEPDKAEDKMTEAERDAATQRLAEEQNAKMGRSFQSVAREMSVCESGFVFRLPAARVRKLQEKIKAKADEFENEYEEKLRAEDEERMRASSMMMLDDERDLTAMPPTQPPRGGGAAATRGVGSIAVPPTAMTALDESVQLAGGAPIDTTMSNDATTAAAGATTTTQNKPQQSQPQPQQQPPYNLRSPHSPGIIPSTSFSIGSFGASFLDTRGASMLLSGGVASRTRRLHTQWFGLRWFSPREERMQCGHTALAAAHILFETSRLCHTKETRQLVEHVPVEFYIPTQTDVLCFVTDAGIISVRKKENVNASYQLARDVAAATEEYEAHFDAHEATSVRPLLPDTFAARLAHALGLPYGAECVEDVALSPSLGCYVVRLQHATQVLECKPDAAALRALFDAHADADMAEALRKHAETLVPPHYLAVTALNAGTVTNRRGSDADVLSRVFAPWAAAAAATTTTAAAMPPSQAQRPQANNMASCDVCEEAVSGTVHIALAPYMIRHKQKGRYSVGDRARFYQASERGGYMTCIIIGRKAERVALIGNVVTFLRGTATFLVED